MQQMDRDRDKNGGSNPRPPSLLDKQLEEILRTSARTHRRQVFWRRLRQTTSGVLGPRGRGKGLSAGRLMVMGFALCVAAVLVGHAIAGLSTLLALVGVVLFLSPLFLGLGRRGRAEGRDERIWRGRVINYPGEDPLQAGRLWIERMIRRLRGRPPGGPRSRG